MRMTGTSEAGIEGVETGDDAAVVPHGEVKVNVDTVLLTLKDDRLQVALAPREAPFLRGRLALVGAIMDGNRDADLESVVRRSLADKIGLASVYFEQLYTFSGRSTASGRQRDSRWPSISVAYIALVPHSRLERGTPADKGVVLVPVDELPELPFDHNEIVGTAVARLRGKGAWSVLPAHLLEEEFTIPDMERVYSKVVGTSSMGQNFRRKVFDSDILEPVGKKAVPGTARPPQHYRLKPGVVTVDKRL